MANILSLKQTYLESGMNGHIGKPLNYDLTMDMLKRRLK